MALRCPTCGADVFEHQWEIDLHMQSHQPLVTGPPPQEYPVTCSHCHFQDRSILGRWLCPQCGLSTRVTGLSPGERPKLSNEVIQLRKKEKLERLRLRKERLQAKHKKIIGLYERRHFTIVQTARTLKVSEHNVRYHLQNACLCFRNAVQRPQPHPSGPMKRRSRPSPSRLSRPL